ncbi:hypothetical protein H7Y63_00935 [Polaromonas sp.]|nr:hypothetical protein [Candidatus Saccharibacteria bacterium]
MKKFILNIFAALSLLFLLTAPAAVYAAPDAGASTSTTSSTSKQEACAALKQLDATKACGTGGKGVGNLIKVVINILSFVVGIAAVIMVIISGLKYVTSGGDSNGISSAKSTLIYALVGLAVAATAQLLVRFVLVNVK